MMTMSSAQDGPRPAMNGIDGSYRSSHPDSRLDLDADGFPRQPPHAPNRSADAVPPASSSSRPPDEPDLNEAPTEPPRAGFSFPALHLGSFSSLKMDDFANFPSSTLLNDDDEQDGRTGNVRSSTPAENDPNVEHDGEPDSVTKSASSTLPITSGGNLQRVISPLGPAGASTSSPNGKTARPSPSLYDVTRMARSGSPFRPVPAPTTTQDTSMGRPPHQLSTDQALDQDVGQDSDVFLDLPVRAHPPANTGDYLIDSPGFLSEEGSQAFLRQSRIARRRTIVQDPNGQNRDGEDDDGFSGQVRSRQGSRDMGLDGPEGVPSRKASTVGQLDSVDEITASLVVLQRGSSSQRRTDRQMLLLSSRTHPSFHCQTAWLRSYRHRHPTRKPVDPVSMHLDIRFQAR